MAELQIPNYMTNRPESIVDLVESAMRMQASQQEQRLNEMKMAEAEQLAPAKRQLYEAQAQDEATTAMLRKQKVLGTLANNVLGQLNKSGIQDQNQRNAFIKQAIDAHKPYLQGALGLPVNEYIDEQQLQSLASSATSGAEYHPPVTHAAGIAEWTPQGWRNVEINGQQLKPGQYDVATQNQLNRVKAINDLIEKGHISPQEGDALLGSIAQTQRPIQPQQVPMVEMDKIEERALIQAAREDNPDIKSRDAARARIEGLTQQPQTNFNPIPSAVERKQAESKIEQQSKIPEREQHQATQYQAQSKPFRELSEAYQKTKTLFDKAKDSAPATLAAATAYMKLLDPGSVVRESELGMALAATGKLDKASNFMNEIQNGKVLTASQVKEFKAAVEDVYKASKSQQLKLDKHYKETAERNKLNPKNIIQDVGQYGDYKSADELKAAVANGQLDIEEAKDIARMKFGME